jgi:hypothetical protein
MTTMTTLTTTTRLQRSPDLLSAEMDGELVMMSVDDGAYFGLGGVGAAIRAMLAEPTPIDAIVREICRAHAVDEAVCLADVLAFTDELVRNGAARIC